MPEVSVIMSVYNAAPYLRECMDSVLAQTFTDFEFLIVDDGSTDDSLEIVRSYEDSRIQIFTQENTGVAAAKNNALKKANAPWIAIIDSDDIWEKEKLQRQMNFLQSNPDYVIVGTFVKIIDKDGEFLYIEKKQTLPEDITKGLEQKNQFTHSSVVFSRDLALKYGGYYEKVKQYLVDYMLLYQINKHGKSTNLPEPLTRYRIVPTSVSAKNDPPEFHQIVKATLQRGYITEKEYQQLLKIKKQENKSPEWRQANYYYYLGRVYLFYNFNRALARKNLKLALEIYPSFAKARMYYAMSLFLPKPAIRWMYRRYFGNSEYMLP